MAQDDELQSKLTILMRDQARFFVEHRTESYALWREYTRLLPIEVALNHIKRIAALEELLREYRNSLLHNHRDSCRTGALLDGSYDWRCDLCKRADALLGSKEDGPSKENETGNDDWVHDSDMGSKDLKAQYVNCKAGHTQQGKWVAPLIERIAKDEAELATLHQTVADLKTEKRNLTAQLQNMAIEAGAAQGLLKKTEEELGERNVEVRELYALISARTGEK